MNTSISSPSQTISQRISFTIITHQENIMRIILLFLLDMLRHWICMLRWHPIASTMSASIVIALSIYTSWFIWFWLAGLCTSCLVYCVSEEHRRMFRVIIEFMEDHDPV